VKKHLPLAMIITAAAAVRLAHLLAVRDCILLQPRGFLDDSFYHQLAQRLAAGDFALGHQPFFLAPLYLGFIAGVYRLFGAGLLAPFIIQSLLGIAAVAVIYLAGLEIAGRTAAITAAALAALDGLFVMYGATLLAAALDPFLGALFLLLLIRAVKQPSPRRLALAAAALGLAILNRPNLILAAPLVIALPRLIPAPRRLLSAALAAAALAAVIAPITLRNYLASGDFVLISSHGGLNLYIGNGPEATGFYQAPAWMPPDVRGQAEGAREYLETQLHRPVRPAEVSSILTRMTVEWVREHPGAWLRLMARKGLCLLAGKEAGLNLSQGYLREACSPALWLAPAGMWLLIPLGLAGAVLARRRREVRAVGAFTLIAAASVALFFVSDRYRLVLHAPLAVLAGAGAAELAAAWSQRRMRDLAAALAVLLIAAALAAHDPGVPTGDGQMRLSHMLRLLEDGRVEEAKRIEAGMPPEAMNPFGWRDKLAGAYLAAGDPAAARAEIEVLIRMVPEHGPLHCRLAEIELAAGGRDAARAEIAAGLRLAPDDPLCRRLAADPALAAPAGDD
jgi:4-amino-4-deoxy-L-arabinose transferase-like glycosyltransferase